MTFTRQRSDGTHETNSFTPSSEITRGQNVLQATGATRKPITSRLTALPFKNIATFAIAAFAITVPTLIPAEARYYSRYKRYNKSQTNQKYSRNNYRRSGNRSSNYRKASYQKTTRRSSDEVTTGVWGWTKGSQTYLRVRPSTTTPFVAKVPRHTKLFVWGKFNGWYRIETTDHVFGWVYYQYINAPQDHKLKELSHKKAKIACDRSATQLMYGSPDMLRSYYASYRAPGAMRGLEKLGIRVATSKPRAKVVVKPRANSGAPTRTAVKPAAAKAAPVRVVAKTAPTVTRPNAFTPKNSSTYPAPVMPDTVMAATPAIGSENAVQPAPPSLIPGQNAAPVKPKVAVKPKATAKSKVAAKSKRHKSRNASKSWSKKRNNRAVAGVPPMQVSGLNTITADDILRARENHLGTRHKTSPIAPSANLPARTVEPPAQDNGQAAVQPSSSDLFTAPSLPSTLRAISPDEATVLPLPAPLRGLDGDSRVMTLVSLKKVAGKSATTAKPAAARGQINRGGSPRDYARLAAPQNGFGDGMATQALSYRGMPYIRGASSPSRGFDCSGLVYYLLRQRGYNPPRTSSGLASYGTPVARKDLAPGDILLFANTYRRGVSHVGVYLGNDKFVHAANRRAGVRVDPLFSGHYARKFHSARRVPVKK